MCHTKHPATASNLPVNYAVFINTTMHLIPPLIFEHLNTHECSFKICSALPKHLSHLISVFNYLYLMQNRYDAMSTTL